MANEPEGPVYVIRVRTRWHPILPSRFPGFAVSEDSAGNTLLTGRVPDQAALYGLISRARDLGLKLISLEQRPETDETDARGNENTTGRD
jgi:hypothetical protein